MMKLRFLEAERTPLRSRGGWAVPPNFGEGRDLYMHDLVERFSEIGLEQNHHYRVLCHGRYDNELVTRVIFNTDEDFIAAKIAYG